MPSFYRIGELTGEFGVTPRTLRFYEEKGLLAPERRGNVRLYAEVEREKLAQIVQLTRFGFTIAEVELLLRMDPNGMAMVDRLSKRQADLTEEIRQSRIALDELGDLITELRDRTDATGQFSR